MLFGAAARGVDAAQVRPLYLVLAAGRRVRSPE
jgi:hypothetical protein